MTYDVLSSHTFTYFRILHCLEWFNNKWEMKNIIMCLTSLTSMGWTASASELSKTYRFRWEVLLKCEIMNVTLLLTEQSEQQCFHSSRKQQDDLCWTLRGFAPWDCCFRYMRLHHAPQIPGLPWRPLKPHLRKAKAKQHLADLPLALLHHLARCEVCVCLSRPVWSGRKHSWAAGLRHPSITVNKRNGGPLHHFIYYFNDYIDHCPLIVSVIDLINFQLITEGDI